MARKKIKKQSNELNQKTFWAVVLIFVGVFLLARNLGLIPDQLALFWPVLLVMLGLIGLSQGLSK
ncbi:LiaI-LiaF-like domain-containing protein [Patescibacteria group bacterium]